MNETETKTVTTDLSSLNVSSKPVDSYLRTIPRCQLVILGAILTLTHSPFYFTVLLEIGLGFHRKIRSTKILHTLSL